MGICRDCQFFDRLEAISASHDAGLCRRYAPQPFGEENPKNRAAFWPHVIHTDWCGEFVFEDKTDTATDASIRAAQHRTRVRG